MYILYMQVLKDLCQKISSLSWSASWTRTVFCIRPEARCLTIPGTHGSRLGNFLVFFGGSQISNQGEIFVGLGCLLLDFCWWKKPKGNKKWETSTGNVATVYTFRKRPKNINSENLDLSVPCISLTPKYTPEKLHQRRPQTVYSKQI